MVSLSHEAGSAISNSEDVGNGTDTAMSRHNVDIADEHERVVLVGLHERRDINAESAGKLGRVKA
jgi:hypothetical protein